MLDINALTIAYEVDTEIIKAVQDVYLAVKERERIGVVGESGSGKSSLALAVARLLPSNARVLSGEILWYGTNILSCAPKEIKIIRKNIALIFQNAAACLNPLVRVGWQIADIYRSRVRVSKKEAWHHAINVLAKTGFTMPEYWARRYPFELSGGMAQRVLIAMAISAHPKIIVADEPTSGLDAHLQSDILSLLSNTLNELGAAAIVISHDISTVINLCERIAVMYQGEIVEEGPTQDIIESALHPYTKGLLASFYGISKGVFPFIPGTASAAANGCSFAPRCTFRIPRCLESAPPVEKVSALRKVKCWKSSAQDGGTG